MNTYQPSAFDEAFAERENLLQIRTIALKAAVEVQGQSRPEPTVVVKHATAYEEYLKKDLPTLPDPNVDKQPGI